MHISKKWYSLSTMGVQYKNMKSKLFLENDLDGPPGMGHCECHLGDGSPRVIRKWFQWLLFIAFPNRPSYVADHTFSAFQPLPVALWVIVNMGQNTKKSTWTIEDRTFLSPSRINFSKQIWYSLSTRWVLYKNIKSKFFFEKWLGWSSGHQKVSASPLRSL